ncbi:MAG: 4-(cytidine 5'-diphospho)-2-C-methyl-D-erythritol kinase [Chthonomonas sp.]|nr:4-(cytidine 5'-diphospho)-2-C-methyl-D-erythritol kinase [Chthonomonas sp.]
MVRVVCPAKLNLFLNVSPPLSSGYHAIVSEFQAISLIDTIDLSLSDGPRTLITSNWDDLPTENTLTKVLGRMHELIDVPPLRVHLEKRIPSEAGLGGGSSNAAGMIRGLLALLRTELPWGQEHAVAASIGADVPFFLIGGRAHVSGTGTEIEALPDGTPRHFVVIKPPVGMSTPHAYRQLDDQRGDFQWEPQNAGNDFELVAPAPCHAAISALQQAGAKLAQLTGSGSAVFGEFDTATDSEAAARRVTDHGQVFVTRSLSRVESLATVQ